MAEEITILHISDLHTRGSVVADLKARVAALLDDISRQNATPDLILLTGDVAYSGKSEEYAIAEDLLIAPLQKKLQIGRKKIFAVPGNHDVDREAINLMEEAGLKRSLKDSSLAAQAFSTGTYSSSRLSGFAQFLTSADLGSAALYGAQKVSVHGFDVGIACLNSAWRCAGDKDKGKLFLTRTQLDKAAERLDGVVLRLALVHHPFDWYHESESELLEDLKRNFEIILSGHLHSQVSVAEQTTNHNSLLLTVPALYDGHAQWEGYNIYRIDIRNRTFQAHFRKFIRKRGEFDADTAHARAGRHIFQLPVRDIATLSRAVTVQRIDACRTKLQSEIKAQLQVIQKVPNPVLITPKIAKITWTNGIRMRTPLEKGLAEVAGENAVIVGPADSGKTILLESLAADIHEAQLRNPKSGSERMPLYIDCSRGTCRDKMEFCDLVRSVAEETYPEEQLHSPVLFVDNLSDNSLCVFDCLPEISAAENAVFVVAVASDLLFDSLPQKQGYDDWTFYELNYWGPSRIREFVTKYFEGTAIDKEAAFSFVSNSLEDTDLPASPWVVALYLSIFPTLGKQVSSLSFVRLLEKIEEDRLGRVETSSADSLYNKREILMRLACECMDRGTIVISRSSAEEMVRSFFQQKYLDVNVAAFLQTLGESGLILMRGETVRFTYFAFYDYFLARAFEKNLRNVDTLLTSLEGCLSVGHALCLYGGLFRDNTPIARKLLQFVGTAFKATADFTLDDLDKYITDLLLENDQKCSADEIADRDLKKEIKYEIYDEEFERRKAAGSKQRAAQIRFANPHSRLEQLNREVLALKTFYNLFRNLENLNGPEKVQLLDKVLDFHIQCTLNLIEFLHGLRPGDTSKDYRTLTTYITTISGQVFLANNIANQSLQHTITEARRTCRNNLKELLLVCLYAELRLSGYQRHLEDYVKNTDSLLAAELIYIQTRILLVTHDSRMVPASLISAFQSAFRRRHQLLGGKVTKGSLNKATPYDQAYSAEVESAKKQHLQFFNAREELIRSTLYD